MVGMLRANRPWRLGVRLYRALIASLAVVAAALVTTDVWRIAVTMGWPRLGAIAVFAVLVTTVTLIAAHDLWESGEDERSSDQIVLFNIVTSLSLLIGLLTLYAALLLVTALGALLLVSMPLFHAVVARPVGAARVHRADLAGRVAGDGGRGAGSGARGRLDRPRGGVWLPARRRGAAPAQPEAG